MDTKELHHLIDSFSTSMYGMEYKVYFSNHLSHGIIALYKLGASKSRIQHFIEDYVRRLEKRTTQPDQLNLPQNCNDMQQLLGKRLAYYPIFDHYKDIFKNKCDGSIEDFVSGYFPTLAPGMASSLLHVLIHTGYGVYSTSATVVTEGMAYLHHSYAPIEISPSNKFPFGDGNIPVIDVLAELKNDQPLIDSMVKESSRPGWMEYYKGNAQKRINLLCKEKGDELAAYVTRIKLPDWFKLKEATLEDAQRLMDWVIDCAIIVFQSLEKRNDFFMLHGVTAAWSLRQIFSTFKNNQVEQAIHSIKLFWIVLFCSYLSMDCPGINTAYLAENTDKSWDEIKQSAVDLDTDEHVYKLVDVCYQRSITGPEEHQSLYKCAALLSMSRPFF